MRTEPITPSIDAPLHDSRTKEEIRKGVGYRSPIHARSLKNKVADPLDDDFDKYETDRDRLVDELMLTGVGTNAAIAISGRLLEMSR